MKTKSTLFCLALFICVNTNITYAQVNVQDSLALVDLYKSTNGTHWLNHRNWLKSPVSKWDGIIVGGNSKNALLRLIGQVLQK